MEMKILISFLIVFPACISSHITLQESGGGIKRPGETIRLTCTTSGFPLASYGMSWISQAPGKGLNWMGGIWSGGDIDYKHGLRNRITMARDILKNQVTLQMTDLQPEDTAVYYCARGGSWFDYWGDGTMVTVASATPTAPAVFPLSPCCGDLSSTSQVTMGCLVSGYFPQPVTVQWNAGAISTGVTHFPPVVLSSGHATSISQLTIPAAKWAAEKFQCNVAHAPTSTIVDKNIKPWKSNKPVAPEVRLLHSPCKARSSDATIELMCIISGFYPAEVDITWLENGKPKPLSPYTDRPWKDANGQTFSTTSTVNITQSDWLTGSMYTCQVTHAATRTNMESHARKCTGDSNPGIKVYTKHPNPEDLYLEKKAKLTCIVVNLGSKENLAVSWSHVNPGTLTPEALEVRTESNGTITAISQVPVSIRDWENGETFTCKVEHAQELAGPIYTKMKKETGDSTAPSVYLSGPHIEELNSDSQHVTLTALVQGFKPSDISVKWLKGGQPLTDNYAITPVLCDGDETYFLFSKLKVLRSHWNRGDSYTFMAVHQGLSSKFIQKSIQKTQGK